MCLCIRAAPSETEVHSLHAIAVWPLAIVKQMAGTEWRVWWSIASYEFCYGL